MADHLMTRRTFVHAGLGALGACSLAGCDDGFGMLERLRRLHFRVGVNYPWLNYGLDFGANAWGYNGIAATGWVPQTYVDSQGLTDARRSTELAHGGQASLRVQADLLGGHPNRDRGEVYLDLAHHAPPGLSAPLDLRGRTAGVWIHLPAGAAEPANMPFGVQFIFKSRDSAGGAGPSFYSPWQPVKQEWPGRWTYITGSLSEVPSYASPDFDPAQVVAVGVKLGAGGGSTAALLAAFYLDDYTLDTTPPLSLGFEIEEAPAALDFRSLADAAGGAPRIVRVFVFADGRAAPRFTPTGAVASPGLEQRFFDDFDALLQLAEANDVRLIPVLADFWWCHTAREDGGVRMGGHTDVIRDPAKRQSFLDNALEPLVGRYAGHPAIVAWEVMNEPEWAVRELATGFRMGDPVSLEEMRAFVQACAGVVHRAGGQVTLGAARRKWLEHWKGLGLDLYQFHWYEWMAGDGEPFPWPPASELRLDGRCIVGEVPTSLAATPRACDAFLHAARDGGYDGLLFWSYRAGDEPSDFTRMRACMPNPRSYPSLAAR